MRLNPHTFSELTATIPNRPGDTISTPYQYTVKAWAFADGDLDIEVLNTDGDHLASITVTQEGDVDITYMAYKEARYERQ